MHQSPLRTMDSHAVCYWFSLLSLWGRFHRLLADCLTFVIRFLIDSLISLVFSIRTLAKLLGFWLRLFGWLLVYGTFLWSGRWLRSRLRWRWYWISEGGHWTSWHKWLTSLLQRTRRRHDGSKTAYCL